MIRYHSCMSARKKILNSEIKNYISVLYFPPMVLPKPNIFSVILSHQTAAALLESITKAIRASGFFINIAAYAMAFSSGAELSMPSPRPFGAPERSVGREPLIRVPNGSRRPISVSPDSPKYSCSFTPINSSSAGQNSGIPLHPSHPPKDNYRTTSRPQLCVSSWPLFWILMLVGENNKGTASWPSEPPPPSLSCFRHNGRNGSLQLWGLGQPQNRKTKGWQGGYHGLAASEFPIFSSQPCEDQ